MMRVQVLVLFAVATAAEIQFPGSIFKCTRQSINQECGPDSANRALPQLLQGDTALGIPSFFPFKIPALNFDTPQLKMRLENIDLGDFSTLRVLRTNWQPPIFSMRLEMDKVSLTGDFGEGTQVFGANLPRAGKANFTLGQVIIDIDVSKKRIQHENSEISFTTESVAVRLQPFSKNYKLSELWTGTPYLEITDSDILSVAVFPQIEEAFGIAYKAIIAPFEKFTEGVLYRSTLPPLPPLPFLNGFSEQNNA